MVKLEHIRGLANHKRKISDKPVDTMDTLPFPVAVICLPSLYQ